MTTLIATPQSANPKALKEQWIQQLLEEVSQKSAAFDSATGEIPSTVSCDDDLDHDFDDENPVDALNGGNRHQQLMQDIQHSELIKEALRQVRSSIFPRKFQFKLMKWIESCRISI